MRPAFALGILFGVGLLACNALLGIDEQKLRADAGLGPDGGPAEASDGAPEGSGEASPADAASPYRSAVLDDAPLAYLRFGEAAGAITAADEMNRIDGTYPGSGVTLAIPGALGGDPNTALALGGISTVKFAAGADFLGLAAFSVEIWAKGDKESYGFIIDHEAYPRHGWSLFAGDTGLYFERWGASDHAASTSASPFADGAWHHVVGTWDGTVLRTYVDGALVNANAEVTTRIDESAGEWSVGGQNCVCTANFFTGALDELAIYDVALTPEHIANHFHAAGR
jgi:hypothetical protein